jgi:hypothetical protein
VIAESVKEKTPEEVAVEAGKFEKNKLTNRAFELKKDIQDFKILIWMLFVLFIACLIVGIWFSPILILSGIFGLIILLFSFFINSDKRHLRESEKKLSELKNENN